MTIEVLAPAGDFTNTSFPETVGSIDLEGSCGNFERMLETDLRKMYPAAEVSVRVLDCAGLVIRVDHEDVSSSSCPDALRVHVNVRITMDKLFFYGLFWEDRQTS